MTYRHIFWQSMVDFYFLRQNAIFLKKKHTKAIVHGFVEKWGFEVGIRNQSFYVRMYYMYIYTVKT